MRVIHLKAENFKRLKAIDITPPEHLVVVGGKNGQGKTSTFDAIQAAVSNKKSLPDMPVRVGEDESNLEICIGNLIISKKISPERRVVVEVRGTDGTIYDNPNKILESLYSSLSFDPMVFFGMDAKKQIEVLKSLINFDFNKLEMDYNKAYEERTYVGRLLTQVDAENKANPYNPDIPEVEESSEKLLSELKTIQDTEIAKRELISNVEKGKQKVLEIEQQITKLKTDAESINLWLTNNAPKIDLFPKVDSEAVQISLKALDDKNSLIRKNIEAKKILDKKIATNKKHVELNKEVDNLKRTRIEAIQNAKLPVDGLMFDDKEVFFNNIPLAQLSGADKIKLSVAMGIALNPELKVLLIRDGSLLDEDNMKLLQELAVQYDCQIWIERVGDGKECCVVIEDGSVKEDRTARPVVKESALEIGARE